MAIASRPKAAPSPTAPTPTYRIAIPAARGADLFIAEADDYDKVVRNYLSLTTLEAHLPEIGARRLILTQISDDMLGRLGSLPYATAEDGMVVELRHGFSRAGIEVTTAQVFAIAGPAMVANLTTPLIGIVSTSPRSASTPGDATLLGGVAMASVLFDWDVLAVPDSCACSTAALHAHRRRRRERNQLRVILMRGLIVAAVVGAS